MSAAVGVCAGRPRWISPVPSIPSELMHHVVRTRVVPFVLAFAAALLPPSLSAQPAESAESRPIPFTEGSPTPPAEVSRSREAREFHEAADLAFAATQAFDRGETQEGRKLARLAAARFAVIEAGLRRQGDARGASHLAMERGRIFLDLIDDPDAASEAYADAMADDPENREAPQALHRALERGHRKGAAGAAVETGRN